MTAMRAMITETHPKLSIVVANDRTKVSFELGIHPPDAEAVELFSEFSKIYVVPWDDVQSSKK